MLGYEEYKDTYLLLQGEAEVGPLLTPQIPLLNQFGWFLYNEQLFLDRNSTMGG